MGEIRYATSPIPANSCTIRSGSSPDRALGGLFERGVTQAATGQALSLLENGDAVTAESRLKSLLRDNPDLYITHYGMGTLYALKNELDQAQACFSRALEIFPYFALLQGSSGEVGACENDQQAEKDAGV